MNYSKILSQDVEFLQDYPESYGVYLQGAYHNYQYDYEGVNFYIKKVKKGKSKYYRIETSYWGVVVSKSEEYQYPPALRIADVKWKPKFVKEVIEYNDLVKYMPQLEKWRKNMSENQDNLIYGFGDKVNHALSTATPSLLPGEEKATEIMEIIKAARTVSQLKEL